MLDVDFKANQICRPRARCVDQKHGEQQKNSLYNTFFFTGCSKGRTGVLINTWGSLASQEILLVFQINHRGF